MNDLHAKPGTWSHELISPERAKKYLARNFCHNRSLKRRSIREMAAAIKAGSWTLSHQGIAFDVDGDLVDGQNRLHAIVAAGLTIPVWVYRGLPRSSLKDVDCGVRRSDTDAFSVGGGRTVGGHAHAAVARVIACDGVDNGGKAAVVTRQDRLNWMGDHREAVAFAMQHGQEFRQAAVRGVVGRAFYTADRRRLLDFLRMLDSGVIDNPNDDRAVITLRNWLTKTRGAGGGSYRQEQYERTKYALVAFLDREPIKRLHRLVGDVFPLPEPSEARELQPA